MDKKALPKFQIIWNKLSDNLKVNIYKLGYGF